MAEKSITSDERAGKRFIRRDNNEMNVVVDADAGCLESSLD